MATVAVGDARSSAGEEWLNQMIASLWPYIVSFVEKTMIDTVTPLVNASLPRGFRSFQFESADIGPVPLRVAGVHSYDEREDSEEQVRIKCDVDFPAKPDIRMKISFGTFTVTRLALHGSFGIILRPLMDQIPFFAAIQMYFTRPPSVEVELGGVAAVSRFLPFLQRAIQNAVDQTVADLLVLPNVMVTKMIDKPGLFQKFHVWPMGVCNIRVLEARELLNRDIRKSDPYASVSLGSVSFKTPVISNATNPKWDPTDPRAAKDFIITTQVQLASIELLDRDKGKDDDLGFASVGVRDLIEKGPLWLPLKEGGAGEVKMEAEFMSLAPAPPGSLSDRVLLTVMVERAVGLPTEPDGDPPTPRVDFAVAGVSHSTFAVFTPDLGDDHSADVLIDPTNPRWEQAFNFILPSQQVAGQLVFQVMSGRHRLGEASISLDEVAASGTSVDIEGLPLTGSNSSNAKLLIDVVVHNLVPDKGGLSTQSTDSQPIQDPDWANKLLLKLWPHIATFSEKMIRDVVNPIIHTAAPSFLSGIHFTEVSLGETPLRVGFVEVEKQQGCLKVVADLVYEAEPSISLALDAGERVCVGVKSLKFSGKCVLLLRPFSSAPPFFSVMRLGLLDSPDICMEFSGVAQVANLPGIRSIVNGIIEDQLRLSLVAPNFVMVKTDVDPTNTLFYRSYLPPNGLLRLKLVRARDLMQVDIGTSSDTYTVMTVGATRHKSSISYNNVNPDWNEDFDFLVSDHRQYLKLEVWDKDTIQFDDALGHNEIPLRDLMSGTEVDIELVDADKGVVTVQAEYFKFVPEAPEESSPSLVTFLVQSASGLPADIEGQETHAYVRVVSSEVDADGEKLEASTFPFTPFSAEDQEKAGLNMKPEKPVWEVSLHMLVSDVRTCQFHFEVKHEDNVLAEFDVDGDRLVQADDFSVRGPWKLPLLMGSGSTGARLHMIGTLRTARQASAL